MLPLLGMRSGTFHSTCQFTPGFKSYHLMPDYTPPDGGTQPRCNHTGLCTWQKAAVCGVTAVAAIQCLRRVHCQWHQTPCGGSSGRHAFFTGARDQAFFVQALPAAGLCLSSGKTMLMTSLAHWDMSGLGLCWCAYIAVQLSKLWHM